MKTGTLDVLRQPTAPLFWRTGFQKLLLFPGLISFLVVTPLLVLLYGSFQSANPAGTSTFSVTGWEEALIPIRGWLEFSFWLSYFIPALPIALDWILLLDPHYGGQQRADSTWTFEIGLPRPKTISPSSNL